MDASYKIQRGIHVHLIQFFMCPEFWVHITFSTDTIRKYFPRSYTPKRMQETIIKLLEAWQKKRQRSQDR